MAAIVIESPAAVEPVSRTAMKNFLKVPLGVSADDLLIDSLIQAAREQVEGFTGRSIINKGYRQSLDSFPYYTDSMMSQMAYPPAYYSMPRYSTTLWNYSQLMKLLRSPLQQITKITYTDSVTGQIKSLVPALFNWMPTTEYVLTEQIEDPNNNVQVVTAVTAQDEDATSISGPTPPTWATVIGQTTTDGMLTWTCQGPAPAGAFIYDADSEPPRLFPLAGQFWPSVLYVPNAVQLHFVAGYGSTGAAAPQGLVVAIMQLVSHWYFNREPVVSGSVAQLPNHVEALLWMHRVMDFAITRG